MGKKNKQFGGKGKGKGGGGGGGGGGAGKKRSKRDDDDDFEDEDIEVEKVTSFKKLKLSSSAPGTSGTGSGSGSGGASAPGQSKGKVKGSVKKHKGELKGLEDADPEFYKFLQENDAGLLNFGDDEDDSEDEGDGDGDEYDDVDMDEEFDDEGGDSDEEELLAAAGKKKKKKFSGAIEVSQPLLDLMIKKATAKGASYATLRKMFSMLKTACMPGGDNEDSSSATTGAMGQFAITSPEMYDAVMTQIIAHAHIALYKVLEIPLSSTPTADIEKHKNWKKAQILILSYFKSILHTLESLVEAVNQGQVTAYLIDSLEAYIPFLSPLPRLSKTVLKVLLAFWSKDLSIADDSHNLRGHAFLRIRQMALQLSSQSSSSSSAAPSAAITEECFRSMVLTFSRSAKSFTEQSSSSVIFMAQCITELFRLDPALAYQQAFLHIRQLALFLRTAVMKKSSESVRQVTTWQFLNCIRLWTRVVCAMPDTQSGLGALAFPLTQVVFGVMAVSPSLYYAPLKLHLIVCLQQISAACKTFIPTAARTTELLETAEDWFDHNKPVPSTEVGVKFTHLVKLPPDSLDKAVHRDALMQECIAVLRCDAELYRFNVGVPEYLYLTVRKLKTCVKRCKVSKWRDLLRTVVGQMEQYANWAKAQRSRSTTGSAVMAEFEGLLPAGTPSVQARLAKLLGTAGPQRDMNAASDASFTTLKATKSTANNSDSNAAKQSAKVEKEEKKEKTEKNDKKDKKEKKVTKEAKSSSKGGKEVLLALPDAVSAFEWSDDDN